MLGQVRFFRLLVCPPGRLSGTPQDLAHLDKALLLVLLFHLLVHLVGDELLPGVAEHVPGQVGHGLEPGAHTPVPPEVAHPGHHNVVAIPHQRGHMAQVDFQRQTRLVNCQGRPLLHNVPIGGGADHRFHAQLPEEGAPQDPVAVIQHGPGQPDFDSLCLHSQILISCQSWFSSAPAPENSLWWIILLLISSIDKRLFH